VTGELRDLLARRASDVEVPMLDLDELITQGDRRVRRRRLGLVTTVAAACALIVGGVAVGTTRTDDGHDPIRHPAPSHTPSAGPAFGAARPLVYAAGGVIHLGDRTVGTGLSIDSLDVTDGGAVFTTGDGSIWFTDGSETWQIGATSGGTLDPHSERWGWAGPRWWVATSSTGSVVAWFERQGDGGATDLVVFDAGADQEVGRASVDLRPGFHGVIDVVADDTVLWSEQGAPGDDFYWHYHVGGELREIPRATWLGLVTAEPGRLVVTDPFGDGLQGTDEASNEHADFPLAQFTVKDGRAEPTSAVGNVFYSSPTRPVRKLHLTTDVPDGTTLWIAEWLDDDHFVLMNRRNDLFTCEVSASSCRPTLSGDDIRGALVVPTSPS